MPRDIFDEIAPDKVSGGDIFDEIAPDQSPALTQPLGISKPQSLWNSLVRGVKTAQAIPDAVLTAGTAGMDKPTMRQERRAYVEAMTDPAYQEGLMRAGDDRVRLNQVESLRGPAGKLDIAMSPGRAIQTETVRDLASAQAEIQAIPRSAAQERLGSAKTSAEKWAAWRKDPVELTAGIVAESLPASVAGGVVGTFIGGPGVGTAMGAGASSGLMTFSGEFLGAAQAQGVDITNPQALEAFLNDKRMFDAAFNTALTKAAIVGGVDAATAGAAGRWIEPALKQGLRQRVIGSAKELALQAGGGAGGEALGQVASGQQLDPFDIAMEALAEVATAPTEAAGNILSKRQAEPLPDMRQGNAETMRGIEKSFNATPTKPDIFDEVAAEQSPQSQAPKSPDVLITADSPEQKTPVAVQATSPVPGASQQNQVRAELEALPGAEQDLVQPKTEVASQLEGMLKATEPKRAVARLTSEQTDAGLLDDGRPDDATPTLGDLRAMIAEIKGNQLAPKAATSQLSDRKPGDVTAQELVALSDADARKFFESNQKRGNATQYDAVLAGMKLDASAVPGLEQMRDAAQKAAMDAIMRGDDTASFANQGRVVWMNGAIEGANRKGPNFDLVSKKQSSADAQGTGTTPGQTKLATTSPIQEQSAPVSPVATKWTPTAGKQAIVNLTLNGKGRLVKVIQVQPDGDATVRFLDTDQTQMVKASQIRPTKAENNRMLKADELSTQSDPEQVKRDAAEFDTLVEDYAPQEGWTPAEAYDRNTAMQEQGVANERLRSKGRVAAARAAGFQMYQDNSVLDRAKAMPMLEAYLRQKFPGDNSIAKRRALEDFGRSEAESQETTTVERDQAELDKLAARYPEKSHLQGLRSVERTRRIGRGQSELRQPGAGKGVLSADGASTIAELERIFGVRIIFVQDATFAGVKPYGAKLILINAKANAPMLALVGHELLHHISSVHPGLYADFKRDTLALLKNSSQFRAALEAKGYKNLTDAIITEEMFADMLGDAILDPAFLNQLATYEPNLFKRFARTAVKWLEKLISKAKALAGFESEQYVTDLADMRDRLLNLLRDAGRQTQFEQAGIQQDATEDTEQGQDPFSKSGMQLSEQQISQIREVLRRWSLDTRGRIPETVYRGVRKSGEGGGMTLGRGLYTTTDKRQAEIFTKGDGEIISIPSNEAVPRNPLVVRDALAWSGFLGEVQDILGFKRAWQMEKAISINKIVQALGYDGVQVGKGHGSYFVKYDGDRFSMEGGDLFGTPESVEEQHARMATEKRKADEAKAKEAMQERAGARLIGKDLDTTREMFGAEVKRDKSGQADMFSLEKTSPLWRSNIQSALASWQNKGTAEQLRAHLAKTKGAMDEAEWIGLDEFLKDKPSVTKQQVAEFVKANTVDVQEVTKGDIATPEGRTKALNERAQSEYGKDYSDLTDAQADRVDELMDADQSYKADDTKFSQYQLPGGENYRELLLTLPGKASPVKYLPPLMELPEGWSISRDDSQPGGRKFAAIPPGQIHGRPYENQRYETAEAARQGTLLLLNNKQATSAELESLRENRARNFQSSHFNEANILAHVRFNERTDADGKRVLFIEEVQSDWHQKGRKEGYRSEKEAQLAALIKQRDQAKERRATIVQEAQARGLSYSDAVALDEAISADTSAIEAQKEINALGSGDVGVPNAPFKQTWPMLAMKRMIRYASENGFDRIAWTTGEQQAERYDLSKQASHIQWGEYPQFDGKHVNINLANGTPLTFLVRDGIAHDIKLKNPTGFDGKPLSDILWKDIAKQIIDAPTGRLEGEGLKVGGKGMRKFYDEMLPSEVNKFVKKWGGKVGQTTVAARDAKSKFEGYSDERLRMELEAIGEDRPMSREQRINLLAESSNELSSARVHSLDITPAMKDAALEGFDMFSLPKPPGPFEDSATKRAVRSMLRGQPVPKEFRDVQAKYLGVQKYFEEALRLSIVAARKRVYSEFKTKADREAAMDRLGKYWLGQAPLSSVGGPMTQLAAETFRNDLDSLAMTAAANGMVPDSQVRTWIGNTGEWLKRTYLAFDPTSDWNYDQLNKRRAKEPEIQRIWTNAENYLRTQNPKATPKQIEAEMRSLIDRREVESALFGSAPGESRSGYGANTSSLIKRKDIPPELLEWMGQIKDPIARAQQSSKWMSQFLARNLMQRELAKVGLDAGWFTEQAEGRNHVELYPNVSKLTPVVDPVTGATVTTPSGNIEAEYRSNIDRRHEPLHGLYTSPEMLAALQQFDGMLNTGMAAASRLTNLVPSVILKGVGFWKMGKVALNPISYPVNSFGAIVMRLMAGAVNPLHVGKALMAVSTKRVVIDKNSSVLMQRARANYLLATKQGITGKGIFTREIDASFGRESEPQSGRRAIAALADLVKGRGAGGARVRLGNALMDMLKVPGEIGIKWADDVARVSAFLDELKLSKEANPTFTEQQHADWAAERAGNIYQTYDNLPVVIRDASNLGVLSPFISFTAEMFRNAGWIAYYGQQGLRSDNPALRKDGAQKLAGMAAMMALPIVLAVMTRSTADDDDEKAKRKIEALQRWFTPPWDRGEDMMLVSFSRERIEYIPMSYLLPTAQLSRIPRQVARIQDNENPTRAINQLVDGAMEDVFGSGPIGTAIEALTNTRGEGRKITRAEGLQGWQDRAAYAWKNFRPGVAQLADEWFMAQAGEKGFGGREYTTEEIGMKLAGLRVRTVSPKQAIPFVMRDFNQRWREASAVATLQAERTPTNKEAIKEAQDYRATKQAAIKNDFAQFIKDAALIGWKQSEVMMLAGEEKIYLPKELKDSIK